MYVASVNMSSNHEIIWSDMEWHILKLSLLPLPCQTVGIGLQSSLAGEDIEDQPPMTMFSHLLPP